MFERLRRWFSLGRDNGREHEADPRPLALDTPGTWTLDQEGEFIVDVTLRLTERLYDRRGRIPEEMAAAAIATALAHAGLGYRIRFGFDPVALPTEQAACRDESEGGDARDAYEPIVAEWSERARDANLVLTDAASGGCSLAAPPRAGCVGARTLAERRPWTREGQDDWHATIQAVLHELGHLLGASHDHDDEQAGRQHPGMGWNDHDQEVWRYTPTVFGNDVVNRCGERVPQREYETGVRIHEYHDCAIEVFEAELTER
jgi:hypothetical protein